MVWDGIVACDLFLAGLGAGAFLLAILAGRPRTGAKKIKLIGSVIGPVAVTAGVLVLMVDAKAGFNNPTRFFGLGTNLGSPMVWGVICLTCFLIISIASLVLQLMKKRVPRLLDVLGIACALGVAAYTGVLLGYSVAYPLWNLAVLPFLFVFSAALSGFSLVSVIAYFSAKSEFESLTFLVKAETALPTLVGVFLVLLLAVCSMTDGDGAPAAAATVQGLLTGSFSLVFWLGVVGCGVALPLVAGMVRLVSKRSGTDILSLASYVGALVGGFALRYVIVVAAAGMTLSAIF